MIHEIHIIGDVPAIADISHRDSVAVDLSARKDGLLRHPVARIRRRDPLFDAAAAKRAQQRNCKDGATRTWHDGEPNVCR
jgi:hypothetical protein